MRASSQKLHAHMARLAAPYVAKARERLRLDERIGAANQWASDHPKRFFGYVIGVSAVILALTIIMGLHTPEPRQPEVSPRVSSGGDVGAVISGMREIHAGKAAINETVMRAKEMGDRIKHELDSLNSLPVKSHQDSIDIRQKGKQLERIIKLFEQHEKD